MVSHGAREAMNSGRLGPSIGTQCQAKATVSKRVDLVLDLQVVGEGWRGVVVDGFIVVVNLDLRRWESERRPDLRDRRGLRGVHGGSEARSSGTGELRRMDGCAFVLFFGGFACPAPRDVRGDDDGLERHVTVCALSWETRFDKRSQGRCERVRECVEESEGHNGKKARLSLGSLRIGLVLWLLIPVGDEGEGGLGSNSCGRVPGNYNLTVTEKGKWCAPAADAPCGSFPGAMPGWSAHKFWEGRRDRADSALKAD